MTQHVDNNGQSGEHALVAETSVQEFDPLRGEWVARRLGPKQAPPTPGAPHPPKSPPPAAASGLSALEGPGEFQPSSAVGSSGPGVESDMRGSGPDGTMGAGIGGGGIGKLVSTRGTTHGGFEDVANVAQAIKRALADAPSWPRLSAAQREALESKATKLARIVCGDPNFPDHWLDDAGYTSLVLERLPRR